MESNLQQLAEAVLAKFRNGELAWGEFTGCRFARRKGVIEGNFESWLEELIDINGDVIAEIKALKMGWSDEKIALIAAGKIKPNEQELDERGLFCGEDEDVEVIVYVPLECDGVIIGWAGIAESGPAFHHKYRLVAVSEQEEEIDTYINANYLL
ncbi:hypothetical protein [Bosea sp. NBC_00550]|uniref:hypothetical protein n=1 Tax=Bosea sp. NBC_00550 TaxID=2969621 RepID=UPI00222FD5A2|nr:hypothetical protein [Bosea sp. NBC_00550]UZF93727.1 hypothetical protein NWE53_05910 [Bosea sp. NBC_00550]